MRRGAEGPKGRMREFAVAAKPDTVFGSEEKGNSVRMDADKRVATPRVIVTNRSIQDHKASCLVVHWSPDLREVSWGWSCHPGLDRTRSAEGER